MWIAVVAVVVVALVAVVAKLTWRPSADEAHSVRSYQSALGTIEHLSERADRPSVRVIGSSGEPTAGTPSVHIQGAPGERSVPPVPVRDSGEFPDPDAPIVFDDTHPTDRSRRSAEASADGFRSERARRQALQSMNHRPRRWAVTTVVVVALLGFGALAFVGSRRSGHPGHASATTAHGTTATTAHGTTVPHRGTTTTRPTSPPRTTPTTRPTQIVATTSTAGAATYPVDAATYKVTLSATGECWVDATNRTTGTTVFTGTMTAGSSQVLSTTGPMTVELGATTATMTLNGIPVVLPSPLQSPFTATFEPTAAATAAAAASGAAAGAAASSSTLPASAGTTTTTAAP